MKTASIPSLRVTEELRQAAEAVLDEGESLSSFMEQSLRANIERRRVQKEFIARGLASEAKAERTGIYYPAEVVLAELREKLEKAEARAKTKAGNRARR